MYVVARWAELQYKDKVYFAKFDVDAIPDLAKKLEVVAMPSFSFYKDGEDVHVPGEEKPLKGANPPKIQKALDWLLTQA